MSVSTVITVSPRAMLRVAILSAMVGLSLVSQVQAATTPAIAATQVAANAQINNFTTKEWVKGVWRTSAGFSIPATAQNKAAFKQGVQVRLADGQSRTIKAVYFSGAHMSAMLSGSTLDAAKTGYPHSVAALASGSVQSQPAAAATSVAPVAKLTVGAADTGAYSSAINNYTNGDWVNGVWRKSAGFSIPASSANIAAFKPGASVKLADGQVRKITAIYTSGKNMSVMLAGGAGMIMVNATANSVNADLHFVPSIHLQNTAYAAVLADVFPGRTVEAALVWTDGPKLMPIPENLLAKSLADLGLGG